MTFGDNTQPPNLVVAIGPAAGSRVRRLRFLGGVGDQAAGRSPLASIAMDMAVLFDLDRTLVDLQTYTDYAAALREVEALIGGWADVPTPATDWDRPTHRCMGVLVALSGDPRWAEVSDTIERHERSAIARSVPMPGLEDALRRTANRRRAVVTLLPASVARAVLVAHDAPIEPAIGRRPDLRPKPAPDQLLVALESIGAEAAETVMIGDSLWDAEAAAAAGVAFIGVTNNSRSSFPPEITTAPNLVQALDLLQRWNDERT